MKYRIIALDVDGTLLNDHHEVTPRVRKAVRLAAEQGVEIVLCTGRGSTSSLPILAELGLQGTMITHNGASIVDSETREILYSTTISPEHAHRYTSYCREMEIHFDMNTAFELYVEAMAEEAASMYRNLKAQPIQRKAHEGFPEKMVKISIYAPKETLDGVENDWLNWQHDLQTVRSGDNFIDVQHLQATKGKALEQLASLRGVPWEQILAIGNYYNDIGMIAYAGWGVAMDNSPPEVKAEADEVTVSNNEDGVALVIERHVLAE
ncbi:Cof-type HAD-IIB family hydrolase [Cohnella silvisoli]|uniref:Cof-type HAD-IIB family hydrolase n=1 Tax=Cohnella silvisoli TaxID=2873699 RepID=A0ABV1KPX4_9BACL|nr:Cof-type HAD-IIB family hydrolase [Cohnella silvisoli]MCD9025611.1 Cof-type HAD-IIB family hydrolase [Cohnella silvisoli]